LSSAPQYRSAIDCTEIALKSHTGQYSGSPGTAAASSSTILLVGRNGSWGSAVLQALEKHGCELSLVSPETATPDHVRESDPAIVLLDSTVSPEQRRMITAELAGSRASVFYTFPVENGCWWLPALLQGEDCLGSPAFRRKEFPQELERILSGQTET
jgi:hypothetical protein